MHATDVNFYMAGDISMVCSSSKLLFLSSSRVNDFKSEVQLKHRLFPSAEQDKFLILYDTFTEDTSAADSRQTSQDELSYNVHEQFGYIIESFLYCRLTA